MEMKYLAILLFFGTSTAFWFDVGPVDCEWRGWEEIKCMKTANGNYMMLERREKIDAINGGKPCNVSEATRMITQCDGPSYVASTMFETITSVGNAGGVDSSSTSEQHCAPSFTDPSTGITMLGAQCDSDSLIARRRRRSVSDEIAKSRVRRQFGGTVADHENRDVLFLIDSSGSVGANNFKKEIAMAKTIAGQFCGTVELRHDRTRAAVMTFDTSPHSHVQFDDYLSKNQLLNALDAVVYTSGSTCLIKALDEARNVAFTEEKGSRVDSATTDGLVILITDGCLNCYGSDREVVQAELQRQAELFADKGISLVIFAIGVDSSCTEDLRYLQDATRCYQQADFPDWSSFDIMRRKLAEKEQCIDRWTKNNDACT